MATTKRHIMVTDHSDLSNSPLEMTFLVLLLHNITFVFKQFNPIETKWYKITSVHRFQTSLTIYSILIKNYHVIADPGLGQGGGPFVLHFAKA